MKKGLPEVIARAMICLYPGSKTKLRVGSELSEECVVQVDVNQKYVLSPLLFAIVVDVIAVNARDGLM